MCTINILELSVGIRNIKVHDSEQQKPLKTKKNVLDVSLASLFNSK